MSEKTITLYNPGPTDIQSFRATRTQSQQFAIDIGANQCADVPVDVASLMLRQFPFLRMATTSDAVPEAVEERILTDMAKQIGRNTQEDMAEMPEDEPEPKCVCSNCGFEAKSKAGLSWHIRKHEKKTV